jgi:hypothetical protein
MTHITDSRVIGNHADMGGPPPADSRKSLTVNEILRAGADRRTRRMEMASAQSMWDSEGGAAERVPLAEKVGRRIAVPRGHR